MDNDPFINIRSPEIQRDLKKIRIILEEERDGILSAIKVAGEKLGNQFQERTGRPFRINKLFARVERVNLGGKFPEGYAIRVYEKKNFISTPLVYEYFVEYGWKNGFMAGRNQWFHGHRSSHSAYHDIIREALAPLHKKRMPNVLSQFKSIDLKEVEDSMKGGLKKNKLPLHAGDAQHEMDRAA